MKKSIAILVTLSMLLMGGPGPFISQARAADWFSKFSGSFIQNEGSIWESQKMGHYSGGGLSYRTPVDRTPFFNITPPRIEAGCGGIDAFWGGFSFMNKEFLIQKMKNILQAAPAYAFNLALQHLCQSCMSILASLEAIANEMNALAMDDCKASQALVNHGAKFLTSVLGSESTSGENTGGGASFLDGMLKSTADGLASFRSDLNKFLDYRYGCGSKSGQDKDECRKKHTLEGSIWRIAVDMANERGGDYKLNANYENLARSLYGDIVFQLPDKVPSVGKDAKMALISKIAPCEGSLNTLVDVMMSTELIEDKTVKVRAGEGQGDCVEVSAASVLTSEDFFFGKKAVAAVLDIQNAMYTGNAVSSSSITMINQSIVPIYTALNILNLRSVPRSADKTQLSSEEAALAKMLAASNALYILTSLHASAQEIMGETTPFVGSLIENGPYDRKTFEDAESSMRASMNGIAFLITQQIDKAGNEYHQSLDAIVRVHSMRTIFQTLVADKMF